MLADAIQTMMTESDNRTHDLYRYMALLTILVGLALEIYSVIWVARPFSVQEYGIGAGALFVGMGAAMRLKGEQKMALAGLTTSSTTAPPPIIGAGG